MASSTPAPFSHSYLHPSPINALFILILNTFPS